MKKTTDPSLAAATTTGNMDVGFVEALARIAAEHDLSEVEVEREGLKVRVARQREAVAVSHVIAQPPAVAPSAAPAVAAAVAAEPSPADHPGVVKSPMVGTAYLRPSPEAKAFIEIGTIVKVGEKLLLVEAMKTFNEIVATRAGKVTQILVENGSPVEYDQPLLIVE
jgi:acetyl-CoA carboxylase biotin carboxyl carrier protein